LCCGAAVLLPLVHHVTLGAWALPHTLHALSKVHRASAIACANTQIAGTIVRRPIVRVKNQISTYMSIFRVKHLKMKRFVWVQYFGSWSENTVSAIAEVTKLKHQHCRAPCSYRSHA
jgi:hypothetical protein